MWLCIKCGRKLIDTEHISCGVRSVRAFCFTCNELARWMEFPPPSNYKFPVHICHFTEKDSALRTRECPECGNFITNREIRRLCDEQKCFREKVHKLISQPHEEPAFTLPGQAIASISSLFGRKLAEDTDKAMMKGFNKDE